MRNRLRAGRTAASLLILSMLASAFGTWRVFAADGQPPGPDRFAVMTVDYTSYEWWMARWSDSTVACQILVDHKGLPTGGEIYAGCGEELYDKWALTEPCDDSEIDPAACQGYYLQFVKSSPAQRQIGVALPPPAVWLTLDGCIPVDATHRCSQLPALVLTGEEPLPNEHITGLAGSLDGKDFTCDPVCQVDLAPTGPDGMQLQFWAFSSYGDSSQVFEAQVRVVFSEADDSWYVDVLSTQWRGAPLAGCSQTWEAFPPVGGLPDWLSTPERPEDLASNIPLAYLAGNLIAQGAVDAEACLDGGLLPNGMASTCGLEAAREVVVGWQNRFDSQIFAAAQDTGIPAQLLKRMFARESQFWPGVFTSKPEAGLGQLTENGADTTLLWNPSFYEQFCPLVLEESVCRQGYPQLKAEQQAMLRGALVHRVDVACADCPYGLDLTQAGFSIPVFAATLLANCAQSGTILHNATGDVPGEVSNYEDLWRFTLVNYNAGPGCLTLAVQETVRQGLPLDWENVSANLTEVCQGAKSYVEDISRNP